MIGRPKLVLASGSPRRLALLAQIGLEPDVLMPAEVDETPERGELPRTLAVRLAREKAERVIERVRDNHDLRDAYILGADTVVAVEEDADLAAEAQRVLSQEGVDNAVVVAGPLAAGAAKHGPYDVITVEGGVEALPEALLAQLKDGGRIAAIFVDGALGTVRTGVKQDGRVVWRFAFNAAAPHLPGFDRARGFVL